MLADTPALSVVIPAFNAAWCVAEAIDSVALQPRDDLELIVVDDGSTDDTARVVERRLGEHSFRAARIIRQENRRLGGARNTGIRAATADLVAFLDADDVWYPDKVARVLDAFRAAPDEVGLVCHDEAVTRNGTKVRVNRYGPAAADMYTRLLFGGNCLSPSAVTVRRRLLLEAGGFSEDPRFHSIEDYDLWMRLSLVTRFSFLHEILGEYRLYDSSLGSDIEFNLRNTLSVLEAHFERFQSLRGSSSALTRRIRRRVAAAHRQAGRLALGRGQIAESRRHLRQARALFPFSLRTLALSTLAAARVRV
jgi:glycosyltransferase involved in cell wall biosynthesis